MCSIPAIHNVGDHFNGNARSLLKNHFSLALTHHPCFIRLIDQGILALLAFPRGQTYGRILRDFRFAMFAHKVQIDGIENQPALRRVATHLINVLCGHVAAAEDSDVEIRSVLRKVIRHTFRIRINHNFDATFAQLIPIRFDVRKVVRQKSHAMTETMENV